MPDFCASRLAHMLPLFCVCHEVATWLMAHASLCLVQEKGQLLENVFADPKGFGISPDGKYRFEQPGFSSGTAAVS